MMTSKERMEAAFQCKEVDRVPVFCEQGGINRRALGITYHEMVTDGEKNALTDLAWHDVIGDDGVGVYFDTGVLAEAFGKPLLTSKKSRRTRTPPGTSSSHPTTTTTSSASTSWLRPAFARCSRAPTSSPHELATRSCRARSRSNLSSRSVACAACSSC